MNLILVNKSVTGFPPAQVKIRNTIKNVNHNAILNFLIDLNAKFIFINLNKYNTVNLRNIPITPTSF